MRFMSKMLNRVFEFGKDKNYFILKPLKEVSDKLCESEEFKLIDFDETKKQVIEEANQSTRASCDGLEISENINFIEFKGFKNVKKKFNEKKNLQEKEDKFISKIDEDLINKIEDSLWILEFILNHKCFRITKEEKKAYRNTPKKYYLVVDIDLSKNSKERLFTQLNALATIPNSLYDNLIISVKSIFEEIERNIKIEKPKLIDCNELKTICKGSKWLN